MKRIQGALLVLGQSAQLKCCLLQLEIIRKSIAHSTIYVHQASVQPTLWLCSATVYEQNARHQDIPKVPRC